MSTNVEECLLNIYLAISAQEAWKQFTFPFWFEWIASSSINFFFFFSEGLHEIHPTRSIVACQNIFCFAAEQESPLKIMQNTLFFPFSIANKYILSLPTMYFTFFFDFTSHYQRLIVGHSKGPERVTWKLASNSLCH